jgi:FtsP/CotA-like multicopper oxidase with cupredoxin domain
VNPPIAGVRYYALAGTDGWYSLPSATVKGDAAKGSADIAPYFPDPLADPANRTTYTFSFRNVTKLTPDQVAAQKGHTQQCAPLFYSAVDEELWITLHNLGLHLRPDLVDSHTVHWHGFRNAIPFYDGVPESSISVPIGRNFTYVYRPKDAGTYMYHCHFEDVEHVTMGMQGIVFVKPSARDRVGLVAGEQKAYGVSDGDAAGETKYVREYALLLSDVDTRSHFNDAHIQLTDWTDFHADFHIINGRSYPDTLEPNGVRGADGVLRAQTFSGFDAQGVAQLATIDDVTLPTSGLASQPLSSVIYAAPGERILIRFANLGFIDRTIEFPGLEVDILGIDSRYVTASNRRTGTDTIQVGPGESRDVFFTAPAEGVYPVFDRGMSHYAGSADGTDSWVGGQRTEIRVVAGLAPQLKPNGWPGEAEWVGEFPILATHAQPVVTLNGTHAAPTTDIPSTPVTLTGSVALDTSVNALYLADLWWAKGDGMPAIGSTDWTSIAPNADNTFTVDAGVSASTTTKYWILARDSGGIYSAPTFITL